MKNLIIPWPTRYGGDFPLMVEFLEGIGYPPVLFILDFIFAHGTEDWALRYGKIEAWVRNKMEHHFMYLCQVIEASVHETVDVIREYKIYYDCLYGMLSGEDTEYEDDIFEVVAVLRHYYSSIVLPDLGETEWSSVESFKDLENGYACVVLNSALGDLINEFYTSTKIEVQSHHPLPDDGFSLFRVPEFHIADWNTTFNHSGPICALGCEQSSSLQLGREL